MSKSNYWVKETIQKDALKYEFRSDWKKNSPTAYRKAGKLKILSEVTSHMKKRKNNRKSELNSKGELVKECGECRIIKLVTFFHKDSTQADGYYHRCKKCNSKSKKYHYDKNKKRINTATVKRRRKNPEKHLDYYLKYAYGITFAEYQVILKKQKGRCKICKKSPEVLGKRLAVDHCHETGLIRGLLCMTCNSGLGSFGDNIGLLKEAIKYLKNAKKNAKKNV